MTKTKKTTFSVNQLRELNFELNGVKDFKGLLKEKLPMVTKYHLTTVAKIAAEVFANSEPLRIDLISTYGEQDSEGNKHIVETILEGSVRVLNPNLVKFHEEWSKVISVEKEIEHYDFVISEFASLETDANYPVFFSIVSAE